MLLKLRLEGKNMMGDPQFFGNCLGIRSIISTAAAKIMKPHGAAGARKSLFQNQTGSNRTVYTAAHADERLFFLHFAASFFLSSISTAGKKVNGQIL
jgi:hypothetical protein